MFDKLIESEPEGADFKNRRGYFMVSSLVVGVLFATAVVISIFAADTSLGSSSFELTELIAPPETADVAPDAPPPHRSIATSATQSQMPTRQVNMARVDEQPTAVPTTISVTPNAQMSRPFENFRIGLDSNPVGPGTSGRETTGSVSDGTGLSATRQIADNIEDTEPPPPVKDPPAVKNPPIKKSGGVLNGKATSLPKPVYSAAARAVGAQGQVNVQVTIDESGKVISANAMGGHPLLRNAAEQAARNARFSPTYLTDVAVKVTGVIVYNFTR